ncbi:MAG: hypothetical protein BroJett042_32010 [Bacteroidota bacterium]|nr:MAG: hypothetical protein BroJett042_32010 [Bacteroidota bacterium]
MFQHVGAADHKNRVNDLPEGETLPGVFLEPEREQLSCRFNFDFNFERRNPILVKIVSESVINDEIPKSMFLYF